MLSFYVTDKLLIMKAIEALALRKQFVCSSATKCLFYLNLKIIDYLIKSVFISNRFYPVTLQINTKYIAVDCTIQNEQ